MRRCHDRMQVGVNFVDDEDSTAFFPVFITVNSLPHAQYQLRDARKAHERIVNSGNVP